MLTYTATDYVQRRKERLWFPLVKVIGRAVAVTARVSSPEALAEGA